jgi:hypothetical protein
MSGCHKHVTLCFNHSMHGIAMQYYGRLCFPMGTCDFWTPAVFTPLRTRLSAEHFEMMVFLRLAKW